MAAALDEDMRILVCLLLVLSPTLFAALTSQHGEAAAAPQPAAPASTPATCARPTELETARPVQGAARDDRNRSQPAHSTR